MPIQRVAIAVMPSATSVGCWILSEDSVVVGAALVHSHSTIMLTRWHEWGNVFVAWMEGLWVGAAWARRTHVWHEAQWARKEYDTEAVHCVAELRNTSDVRDVVLVDAATRQTETRKQLGGVAGPFQGAGGSGV